jgi:hypothetical protein
MTNVEFQNTIDGIVRFAQVIAALCDRLNLSNVPLCQPHGDLGGQQPGESDLPLRAFSNHNLGGRGLAFA